MDTAEIATAAAALADALHEGRGNIWLDFQGDHEVRHSLTWLAEELGWLYAKAGARHTWSGLPEDGV